MIRSRSTWHHLYLAMMIAGVAFVPLMAQERVLSFPEESIGKVTLNRKPSEDGAHLNLEEPILVREAQGQVVLPGEGIIGLDVAAKASADLSFLVELPCESLGTLEISGARLDNAAMQNVAKFQSLLELEFRDCEFTPDAFEGLDSLPELLKLSIFRRSDPRVLSEEGLVWIASQPKLKSFYASPDLSPGDLKTLLSKQVPLRSTSVELGRDAKEVLGYLSQLPQLEFLFVTLSDDVDLESLTEMGNLRQLKHLGWYGGRVDGVVLERIAENQRLEELELSGFEPGENFAAALESLTQLRSLFLQPNHGFKLSGLADHLLKMPQLRNWPVLREVDAQTLDRITETSRIERLKISDVAADVTQVHLGRLAQMKSLRQLELSHVPVDDDWLSSLSGMRQLEKLDLFATHVTGRGVAQLDLPELREVHLWFDASHHGEWIQPDLSSLSHLPALERLHIGGRFRPGDLETLKDCRLLTNLRLWGWGLVDDSTADWIVDLPRLIDLRMDCNSIMTDRGAFVLSRNRGLQRLWLQGSLSQAGVAALTQIPTIRTLGVASSQLSPEDLTELRRSSTASLYNPPVDNNMMLGEDGFLRKIPRADHKFRSRVNLLEGKPAETLAEKLVDSGIVEEFHTRRGKVIILNFWGTWCGPCKLEISELKQLHSKYHDLGLEVIGVHTEHGNSEMKAYVKEKEIPWQCIVDKGDKISEVFLVRVYPSLFIIDRKGIVRVAMADPLGLEDAISKLLNE